MDNILTIILTILIILWEIIEWLWINTLGLLINKLVLFIKDYPEITLGILVFFICRSFSYKIFAYKYYDKFEEAQKKIDELENELEEAQEKIDELEED
ncbi:MAG: hypothetical protein GKR77_06345 [Legionellales bacterium]|nr:hypothetical protein [Legionellales bacterium]